MSKNKIKLIIEVDKKYYEACKDAVKESYPSQIEEVIANGTPYNQSGECEKCPFKHTEKCDVCINRLKNIQKVPLFIDNAPPVPQVTVFAENADEKAVADLKAELQNVLDSERPQGEWAEKEDTPASVYYCCSNCGMEGVPITPFCPWCGAQMKVRND